MEIISDRELGSLTAESPRGAGNDTVLALLGRRPCTADDVAEGLGIHRLEALKGLEQLRAAGQVKVVQIDHKTFYSQNQLGIC